MPTIHVNQRGLAERMARTPTAQREQPAQESEEPGSTQESEALAPQDAPNVGEGESPKMTRTEPSLDESGNRVAFERTQAPQAEPPVHAPGLELDGDSLRDPRKDVFLRREAVRGRR